MHNTFLRVHYKTTGSVICTKSCELCDSYSNKCCAKWSSQQPPASLVLIAMEDIINIFKMQNYQLTTMSDTFCFLYNWGLVCVWGTSIKCQKVKERMLSLRTSETILCRTCFILFLMFLSPPLIYSSTNLLGTLMRIDTWNYFIYHHYAAARDKKWEIGFLVKGISKTIFERDYVMICFQNIHCLWQRHSRVL